MVRRGAANDLVKRASLLRRDSVHGPFEGTITVDEDANTILANGTLIQVIYSDDPAAVDYPAYGIHDAIVVDNTGRWRDAEGLSQHLASPGVARVLLTAPGKGDIKNIVYGINHDTIGPDDSILSAASCTTNAIVPVLKAVDDAYGILHGHVETVHSYTNDQNLIDNMHKGNRRGRSAVLNMVLTQTGAATAAAKALPQLAGKLTGNAIRVPTPNVSMAILNLNLGTETTKEEVNAYLRRPVPGFHPAAADRLHRLARGRVLRLHRVTSRRHRRRSGDNQHRVEPRVVHLVRQRVRLQQPGGPRAGGNGVKPSARISCAHRHRTGCRRTCLRALRRRRAGAHRRCGLSATLNHTAT